MQYGVVFPQIEFGNDPQAIKEYAQTAEDWAIRICSSTIICARGASGAGPEADGPVHARGSVSRADGCCSVPGRRHHAAPAGGRASSSSPRQTALVAKQARR